jgi:hypothetical protein
MDELPDEDTTLHEQAGSHRRILIAGLLALTEKQPVERRAILDRLTEDACEAGIYGGTPEDYAAALKKARRRAAKSGAESDPK